MYIWEVLSDKSKVGTVYSDGIEQYTLKKDFRGDLGLVREYEDDPALFTQNEMLKLDFKEVVN